MAWSREPGPGGLDQESWARDQEAHLSLQIHLMMPDSDSLDVEKAVDAASRAFPVWSKTPAAKRAEYLRKIADKIEEKLVGFAMVRKTGQGTFDGALGPRR